MHSEGIMAGELKHGPLALVDHTMPVMMIVMRDPVYLKCMNALQQVSKNMLWLYLHLELETIYLPDFDVAFVGVGVLQKIT